MEPATPGEQDTDLDLSVHRAQHDGADTSGLDEAVSASNDRISEARRGAAEADKHIRDALRAVEADTELVPHEEARSYEGGDEQPEFDDQPIPLPDVVRGPCFPGGRREAGLRTRRSSLP
jgi:hypothetical protein